MTGSLLSHPAPRYGLSGWLAKLVGCGFLGLALLVSYAQGARADEEKIDILAYGDSLVAGYGLPAEAAFPSQLEAELQARGHQVNVINAGVSGDTTAGGLARLDWTLAGDAPDIVLLALGANDALRGIDPASTKDNLDAMLDRLLEDNIPVLLAGMMAPRNWGREYQEAFDSLYPALAEKHDVPLYPFILEGVATDPALNQADGIHPNAQGVKVMVEGLAPALEPLIEGLKPES